METVSMSSLVFVPAPSVVHVIYVQSAQRRLTP